MARRLSFANGFLPPTFNPRNRDRSPAGGGGSFKPETSYRGAACLPACLPLSGCERGRAPSSVLLHRVRRPAAAAPSIQDPRRPRTDSSMISYSGPAVKREGENERSEAKRHHGWSSKKGERDRERHLGRRRRTTAAAAGRRVGLGLGSGVVAPVRPAGANKAQRPLSNSAPPALQSDAVSDSGPLFRGKALLSFPFQVPRRLGSLGSRPLATPTSRRNLPTNKPINPRYPAYFHVNVQQGGTTASENRADK